MDGAQAVKTAPTCAYKARYFQLRRFFPAPSSPSSVPPLLIVSMASLARLRPRRLQVTVCPVFAMLFLSWL